MTPHTCHFVCSLPPEGNVSSRLAAQQEAA